MNKSWIIGEMNDGCSCDCGYCYEVCIHNERSDDDD